MNYAKVGVVITMQYGHTTFKLHDLLKTCKISIHPSSHFHWIDRKVTII